MVTGHRIAIGLGSNVGDRLEYLRFGVARLRSFVRDLATSPVYESNPIGYLDQPLFLNACCVGRTTLTARQMLSVLQDAERSAGRRSTGPRFGPRELDLDLLLYEQRVIETAGLSVPHPRLRERAFVVVPLAAVAPDWVVPTTSAGEAETIGELAGAIDQKGIVRLEFEL